MEDLWVICGNNLWLTLYVFKICHKYIMFVLFWLTGRNSGSSKKTENKKKKRNKSGMRVRFVMIRLLSHKKIILTWNCLYRWNLFFLYISLFWCFEESLEMKCGDMLSKHNRFRNVFENGTIFVLLLSPRFVNEKMKCDVFCEHKLFYAVIVEKYVWKIFFWCLVKEPRQFSMQFNQLMLVFANENIRLSEMDGLDHFVCEKKKIGINASNCIWFVFSVDMFAHWL